MTDHATTQANRVADVSDALDESGSQSPAIWEEARTRYFHGDVSFLEAFEEALKVKRATTLRGESLSNFSPDIRSGKRREASVKNNDTCPACGSRPMGEGCYFICPNSVHYYSPEQERADDAWYGADDISERYAEGF